MNKDEKIDKLWESSNHGTERKDVVAAYNAGLEASAVIADNAAERLRGSGCGHEAAAVEVVADDIRDEI
jgi:hypothetical protein